MVNFLISLVLVVQVEGATSQSPLYEQTIPWIRQFYRAFYIICYITFCSCSDEINFMYVYHYLYIIMYLSHTGDIRRMRSVCMTLFCQ